MAETFLSPVIRKLLDLLVEEAKSLKGVRRDVQNLQNELEIIEPFLREAEAKSGRGELNDASKVWLKQLQEEAERIEDFVDEYLYNVEKHRQEGGFLGSLRKAVRSIKSLKSRRGIPSGIGDIKESLREIKERGQSYGLRPFEQGGGSSSSAAAVEPRIGSLFLDDDELVGLDSMSKELVTSLVEGSSVRLVISLVGEGGIGKTVLANKVYKDVVAKGHFDCHVWITVSQSCNVEMIIKMMENQICPTTQQPAGGETVTIEELISVVRDSLATKRYMVVFDDVWRTDFWGVIKHALPNNVNGSRIILTTRNALVVESFKETSDDVVHELKTWSSQQAWELFCKKAFFYEFDRCCPPKLEQLSRELLSKCQGLPLAIVTVAGLLSKKEKSQVEWQKVLDNLSLEFDRNSQLSNVIKVLMLSYHELPYRLKLCFLYFGIFPEDESVDDIRLYKLWIAEGFIQSRRDNVSLEHSAEEYLNELINRNLVTYAVRFGSEKWCKVHDLIRELIRTIIDDCCFCHVYNEHMFRLNGRSRRLSNYNIEQVLDTHEDSRVRSVFISNNLAPNNSALLALFEKYKLLTLLVIEDIPLMVLPNEVGNLLCLKYLSLKGTKVKKLPKSVGKLHKLQTLDLSSTLLVELPMEICKLQNLRHLLASRCDNKISIGSANGVQIKAGIGKLESLQTLMTVEAHLSGMDVIQELNRLRQLRSLSVSRLNGEFASALCACIQVMSKLKSLRLHSMNILDLQAISSPPPHLECLVLKGILNRFPDWISSLQNISMLCLSHSGLVDDPLLHLHFLPNLESLWLYRAYEGEKLHFREGGFKKLKLLVLRDLQNLEAVEIEEGSLLLLEELRIGPSPLLNEVPSGIEHFRNLKVVSFYDMPNEFGLRLKPDGGSDYWKVEHVPAVRFCYKDEGRQYISYHLGETDLLHRLEGRDANTNDANQRDIRLSFCYSDDEEDSASTSTAQWNDIPRMSFSSDRFSFFTDDVEE